MQDITSRAMLNRLLGLAVYAAERGEGDAEMARGILADLGFCVVCRHENTEQTDCSCGGKLAP